MTAALGGSAASAYTIDGYLETGIRRLEAAWLVNEGETNGRRQPPGALLPTGEITLRLVDLAALDLPAPYSGLGRELKKLLVALAVFRALANAWPQAAAGAATRARYSLDKSSIATIQVAQHARTTRLRSPSGAGVALSWVMAMMSPEPSTLKTR